MFVYLFRQRRTDNLALTTDVTGRNIPSRPPSTDWIFVGAFNDSKFEPPWDTAHFRYAVRQVRITGFHLINEPGQVLPPHPRQAC
jgi:hypothetical protein